LSAAILSSTRNEPVWHADASRLAPAPDAVARSWLSEPGLLTDRVRALCPAGYALRVLAEHTATLGDATRRLLRAVGEGIFVREIELVCGDERHVFAQTLVPEATLAAQPWLGALGESALGERLARTAAMRGPLEFARLVPGEELFGRATQGLAGIATYLWARRSWFEIGGHRLLVQEVFLPGVLR
jgi:chorismate--pyruvate lyase